MTDDACVQPEQTNTVNKAGSMSVFVQEDMDNETKQDAIHEVRTTTSPRLTVGGVRYDSACPRLYERPASYVTYTKDRRQLAWQQQPATRVRHSVTVGETQHSTLGNYSGLAQAHGGYAAYTCASPATSTSGGAWTYRPYYTLSGNAEPVQDFMYTPYDPQSVPTYECPLSFVSTSGAGAHTTTVPVLPTTLANSTAHYSNAYTTMGLVQDSSILNQHDSGSAGLPRTSIEPYKTMRMYPFYPPVGIAGARMETGRGRPTLTKLKTRSCCGFQRIVA